MTSGDSVCSTTCSGCGEEVKEHGHETIYRFHESLRKQGWLLAYGARLCPTCLKAAIPVHYTSTVSRGPAEPCPERKRVASRKRAALEMVDLFGEALTILTKLSESCDAAGDKLNTLLAGWAGTSRSPVDILEKAVSAVFGIFSTGGIGVYAKHQLEEALCKAKTEYGCACLEEEQLAARKTSEGAK